MISEVKQLGQTSKKLEFNLCKNHQKPTQNGYDCYIAMV